MLEDEDSSDLEDEDPSDSKEMFNQQPPASTSQQMPTGMQEQPPTKQMQPVQSIMQPTYPPPTTQPLEMGNPAGSYMNTSYDPYDPMLEADSYNLTASMPFPSHFTFSRVLDGAGIASEI